jgi:hypothetical protein
MMEMRQKSSQTDGGQTKFSRQVKGGVLTKFVRMLRGDDEEHNSVRERSGPLWLRLVVKVRNASPSLALTHRLRSVLRENAGGLEILHDVGCRL